MNNISQINKAKRLTEEEVHTAADELKETGVKVSSIEVYKFLGRGSLTTITNFLKTWNQEEQVTTLPALISLPESLSKSAEQLIIKLWSESQSLAEKEIISQREALRQAEAVANEKISEAEAFSEEQAKQIEALEAEIETIRKEGDEQLSSWIKEIEKEQNDRHQTHMDKAVCEEKLREAGKRFDYVNETLISQQKANEVLTGENIELKNKLENAEQRYVEIRNQFEKTEEKMLKTENENKKLDIENKVQKNQIDKLISDMESQKEISAVEANENKALREKAAKLEGELIAWKSIKSESKKAIEIKPKKEPLEKSQKESQFKQTEQPE
ncbi:DNA-binding protein [Methylobacter sp.]|uniref:DNA-binding protein n=1 Tax=Methylobacter sp. TaxID=2051955 RepID=UPI002FDEAE91